MEISQVVLKIATSVFRLDAQSVAGNGGIYKMLYQKAVQKEIETSWFIVSEEFQRCSITLKPASLPKIILIKSKL